MLYAGTVPVNKKNLPGTVPVNKEHLTGTVPVKKEWWNGGDMLQHLEAIMKG